MSPRNRILWAISTNQGAMSFRQLERVSGMSYGSMYYQYQKLRDEGIVTHTPGLDRTIHLTPTGKELVRQMRGAIAWE